MLQQPPCKNNEAKRSSGHEANAASPYKTRPMAIHHTWHRTHDTMRPKTQRYQKLGFFCDQQNEATSFSSLYNWQWQKTHTRLTTVKWQKTHTHTHTINRVSVATYGIAPVPRAPSPSLPSRSWFARASSGVPPPLLSTYERIKEHENCKDFPHHTGANIWREKITMPDSMQEDERDIPVRLTRERSFAYKHIVSAQKQSKPPISEGKSYQDMLILDYTPVLRLHCISGAFRPATTLIHAHVLVFDSPIRWCERGSN